RRPGYADEGRRRAPVRGQAARAGIALPRLSVRSEREVMLSAVAATYPAHREGAVVLRDGSTVTVRPVRADDEAALAHFFNSLSLESRVLRFFAAVADADHLARAMVDVDYRRPYGVGALAGADVQIVGHAMYVGEAPRKAELALAIADDYQGRGLGTILLGQLAEAAAAAEIDVLEAIVKPENHRMLSMLRESGFPLTVRS